VPLLGGIALLLGGSLFLLIRRLPLRG
jgi:hypothetical protein